MIKLFSLLLFIFIFACSPKREEKKLTFKLSNFLTDSSSFYLYSKNNETGELIKTDLDSFRSAIIPFGVWSFYLVGWPGAVRYTGEPSCGKVVKQEINQELTDIEINVSESHCLQNPIYQIMRNEKQAANVTSTLSVVKVIVGYARSCAIFINGKVKCWGANTLNNPIGVPQVTGAGIGDDPGEMSDKLPYINLGAGRMAIDIAIGRGHICAVLDNFKVKCWGDNSSGQLGQNNTMRVNKPALLPPIYLGTDFKVVQVAAGNGHTCARSLNGAVKCFGNNSQMQAGESDTSRKIGSDAGSNNMNTAPTVIASGVSDLQAGINHTCALKTSGVVKCWGNASDGRLGSDNQIDTFTPTAITAFSGVQSMSIGEKHSCVLLPGNSVKCWGSNQLGQLGQDHSLTIGDDSAEMAAINSLDTTIIGTVETISAGLNHTCAMNSAKEIYCWGTNSSGELGRGDSLTSVGDSAGSLNSKIKKIDFGSYMPAAMSLNAHTCVLFKNKKIKCFGNAFSKAGNLGYENNLSIGKEPMSVGESLPFVNLGYKL